MKRRSSAKITLVIVGTLALAACGEQEQRNLYRSKEDCVKDWGQEEGCEQVTSSNNYYGGRYYPMGYFYGPRYREGASYGSARSTHAISVARGGFGGLSGFHGGGRG